MLLDTLRPYGFDSRRRLQDVLPVSSQTKTGVSRWSRMKFRVLASLILGALLLAGCPGSQTVTSDADNYLPAKPTRAVHLPEPAKPPDSGSPDCARQRDFVRRPSGQTVQPIYAFWNSAGGKKRVPLSANCLQIEGDETDLVHVPLRAYAEATNVSIHWDGCRRRVKIANSYAPPALVLFKGRSYLPSGEFEIWQNAVVRISRVGSMYQAGSPISMVNITG